MDTRKLKHFIAITEHGSFHRAAEAVHLSQSALSRSIQSLEEELGVTLFDRTGSRAKITPAGTVLLGNARRLLVETHELIRDMARFHEGHLGSIALAVSPTPASVFLTPYLADVSRRRPGLRLDTWIGRTPELVDAVRNEKYDVAVVDASAILDPEGLVVEHLASLGGGFLVRREHPLAAKACCELSEVAAYSVACSPVSDDLGRRMVEKYGQAGHPSRLISYYCDSYHVLRDLALASDAVVMSVFAAMQGELEDGRLVSLPVAGERAPLMGHYAMVRLAARSVSPALAELCAYAREHFRSLAGFTVA